MRGVYVAAEIAIESCPRAPDSRLAGLVEHHVYAIDQGGQIVRVEIELLEFEIGLLEKTGEIAIFEVRVVIVGHGVHTDHAPPVATQSLGEVAPDESPDSCYQPAHSTRTPFRTFLLTG